MISFSGLSMFIDPMLFGDRSDSVQDLPSALMGTRFKMEGDKVHLVYAMGEGLPAQHLNGFNS